MLLAFAIDQIQQMACKAFQKALKRHHGRLSYFLEKLRSVFFCFVIKSWDSLYQGMADILPDDRPVFNDSS